MKYFLPLFCIFFLNCSLSKNANSSNFSSKKKERSPMPEKLLYADVLENGQYKLQNDLDVPEPKQGKMAFLKTMYSNMLYPAGAREKGIQGIVILNINVDTNGKITDVYVMQSVNELLSKSALDAFNLAATEGYNTLVINGKSVNYRIEFPVRFNLE